MFLRPSPALVVALLLCGSALAGTTDIPEGYQWNRDTQWVTMPDSAAGTTTGNPAPDSLGNPVWSYEYTTGGGGLWSSNPWYTQPTTMMVWDNNWYGNNFGAWARGNDVNPLIESDALGHNASSTAYGYVPLVRWTNPAANPLLLTISGGLNITWQGGVTSTNPVDIVIGVVNSANNRTSLLYAGPITGEDNLGRLSVGIPNIALRNGDQVFVTGRLESVQPGWTGIYDTGLDLTATQTNVNGLGSVNLLSNGSFENPVLGGSQWNFTGSFSFPGWSGYSTGSGGNAGIDAGLQYGLGPADGNQYFGFNGNDPPAGTYLEQAFATDAGTQYLVSFNIGRNTGHPEQYLALCGQVFNSGGQSLVEHVSLPPSFAGWSYDSFVFTADSSMSRLRFTDMSGSNPNTDVFLDGISVVVLPEPATLSLLALGGLAMMRQRRRRA